MINVTGNSIIQIYNNVFIKNYNYLLKWSNNDEDLLLDVYYKIHLKLQRDGFLNVNNTIEKKLLDYIKTAIRNTFLTSKTQQKTKTTNKINFNLVQSEVEDKLQYQYELQKDSELYQKQLEFFTKYIFQYLKSNYPDYKIYIFKTYYLSNPKNKKINYSVLAQRTNYSISTVSNIIVAIKKDLKQNLLPYIIKQEQIKEENSSKYHFLI